MSENHERNGVEHSKFYEYDQATSRLGATTVTLSDHPNDNKPFDSLTAVTDNKRIETVRSSGMPARYFEHEVNNPGEIRLFRREDGSAVLEHKQIVDYDTKEHGVVHNGTSLHQSYQIPKEQVADIDNKINELRKDGLSRSDMSEINALLQDQLKNLPSEAPLSYRTANGVGFQTNKDGHLEVTETEQSGHSLDSFGRNLSTQWTDKVVVSDPERIKEIRAGLVAAASDGVVTPKEETQIKEQFTERSSPISSIDFKTEAWVRNDPNTKGWDGIVNERQGLTMNEAGDVTVTKGNLSALVNDPELRDKVLKAAHGLASSGTETDYQTWQQASSQAVMDVRPKSEEVALGK